ncbi:hypothetical protein DI005_17045 [Prauserella sp. PE36]|uniref:YbaB/EbfC family nucleoid-associated protein n=1 Tax=Prauserella endophytica TaxID=1592324 RepID=A0ABY2SBP6_9PSEU|nr:MULTISPECIES: YbaB/EbfC family nucleoid-associated protein [Prauserella]PXY34847.1 hypothetical protein BAY59_04970 [Prauserella coralliicola]RBM19375.1 hypothetical protein DI005_17045 [Prauserella sp. PE36]TKG73374.1 YbaB/EbfC family nucleoid-associated protein [Prauserella endophytica]
MESSTPGIDRARTQTGALLRRINAARAELATERFTYTSPDGLVRATVDGNGALMGITLADGALRTAGLGSQLVTAVNTARRAATLDSRDRLASVIGGKRADALIGSSEYDSGLDGVSSEGSDD